MNEFSLKEQYFAWLSNTVTDYGRYPNISYDKLLRELHKLQFNYVIARDANRESDGIDLRYRFGYEMGYEDYEVADILDDRPCSMLEMMVALSIRCEENLMRDDNAGNRVPKWFWMMLKNMHLEYMDDENFDELTVARAVFICNNRDYGYYGDGGLFVVKNPERDMRNVEIWYQLCWFLDEYMQSKGENNYACL